MCTLAVSLRVFWSIWRPCLRQRVYYTITVTSTYKTACWATDRRCCAGIECCSLEVAVLLLARLPLTHLQVSPSLKQVWGFHPGGQAERLVQWGRTAMFFPNNRVSTRAVNWKTKPPKNNSETQTEGGHNGAEYFSVYWSDATASRLISTEEGFSSSVAANSRPWPDISLQTIQSRDVLWEAGRHRLSLTVRQRGSRRSLAHELPKRAKHAFWQRSLTAKGTTTKCHWTMFIFIHEEGSCSMCRLHNYLIE